MRARPRIFIAFAFALLPGLAAGQTRDQASLSRGQTLVQRNCGACHATGRTGASPFRPAPPFRELHTRYPIENLAEALGEGLITGHPAMPEFRFEPGEINDIIRYLNAIQTRQHARTEPPPFDAP